MIHFKTEAKFAPVSLGTDPVYKTHVRKARCNHITHNRIECDSCGQKFCKEICLDEKFESLCPECRMEGTAFCKICRKQDTITRMTMCTSCKQFVCQDDQSHLHSEGEYHRYCDICVVGVQATNPDRIS